MPDPENLGSSMSGFSVQPLNGQTIWNVLEERGEHYSLMNVAFRNDPVWKDGAHGLDIGSDGYRLWKKPAFFQLGKGRQDIRFGGIELRVLRTMGGIIICKGAGSRANLSVGEGKVVGLTRGLRAYACLLNDSHLVLSQLTTPMLRGSIHPASIGEGFLDLNAFQITRRLNERTGGAEAISIESEMTPSLYSIRQEEDLLLEAIQSTDSKLVIGYFPLIDEFNHVYMDQLVTEWPKGRVSRLFTSCMRCVDGILKKVMAKADPDTLLVISSDHGSVPYRCLIHVNELLVQAGLVRRSDGGYNLRNSIAYYHPSDCGLIVMQPQASRADVIRKLRYAIATAQMDFGQEIGLVELQAPDSYPAFLYPMMDTQFTGSPPRKCGMTVDVSKSGGHHLSPLTPTPWIQAMLGLWSPRSRTLGRDFTGIPSENNQLKSFLLDLVRQE